MKCPLFGGNTFMMEKCSPTSKLHIIYIWCIARGNHLDICLIGRVGGGQMKMSLYS